MGRFNPIDAGIVVTGLVVALGVLAVQGGWHKTSGTMVKGETDIEYSVLVRNLKTMNPNLFEVGKTLSITIRNQPRGDVRIVAVKRTPKQTLLPTPGKGTGYVVIADPVETMGYDFLLKLHDHAQISEGGYVTEGIKVKVGLPIEVEGFDYRVNGSIVDVQALLSEKSQIPIKS